ncbi:MAG: lipoyl(octanoyl) transferase LipB [Gemmatimonadaceae bacterium]
MPDRALLVLRLGLVPYAEALELQRAAARARISGELVEDVLILVEHPPVVTLGRTAKERNLTSSPDFLRERGVELFEVERGGDVTFHGPGQLVGYPIFDLKRHKQDLHWYLRQVEEALIRTIGDFGLPGERVERYTGVWTRGPVGPGGEPAHDPRKIASIGVHARDWVTWHGFALNVTTDLTYFDLIIPCGIDGVVMTSIARENGSGTVAMHEVEAAAERAFGEVFALSTRVTDPASLPFLAGQRVA